MTISEIICRLHQIKCQHGDLEVYHATDNLMLRPAVIEADCDDNSKYYGVLVRPACSKIECTEYPQPYLDKEKGAKA